MKKNMNPCESKADRLAELLGEIDPAYVREALETNTPEALASLAGETAPVSPIPRQSRLLTPGRIRAFVASAAVVLALALVLPVALRLAGPQGPTPGDHTAESAPEEYVDPTGIIPPWRSGTLKLSSMTFGRTETASVGYPSFSLLTDRTDAASASDSEIPSEEATEADTLPDGMIYGEGEEENFTVSIMDNVKITTFMGDSLIKLRPEGGEHRNCPDVYFDIQKNDYFCMSCHILSLLEEQEDYADAAIRCYITECILSFAPLLAAGWGEEYEEALYAHLSGPDTRELFAKPGKLSFKSLGLTDFYSDEHREHVKTATSKFRFPVADIAEYGSDMGKCVFTLVSPRTGVAYGNFICHLETGEVIRIDRNCRGYEILNLAAAGNICITDSYRTVVAALPDFPGVLTPILHTDLYKPVYGGRNLAVFSADTGLCERLLDSAKLDHSPDSPVLDSQGVLTYTGMNGMTYAFRSGVFYALSGELTRVIRDREGTRYAVMKQGDAYTVYALEGPKATPVDPASLEGTVDPGNRYAVEGNLRLDLLNGEALTLWEGEPTAAAASKDGRYLYLYFAGESHVLCLDVWTNESGYLSLSESFTEAAAASHRAVTYNLLLNAEEDRLLMTYFTEGQVTFDADAFRENVGIAGGNVTKAIEEVTDYYLINGEPLRFYETDKALDLLRLLSVSSILDTVVTEGLSRTANIELSIRAAEALIPYLEIWAHSAEVPDGVVESMLGDRTLSMFREFYQFEMRGYGKQYLPVEIPREYGASRREYAVTGLSRALAAKCFDVFGVPSDTETESEIAQRAYELLDPIVDADRMLTRYDLGRVFADLLRETAPVLTGTAYDEFIRSARFLETPEAIEMQGCHFVTTDRTAGDIRCGLNLDLDQAVLKRFLEGLTFTEGEVSIRPEIRVTRRGYLKYGPVADIALLEVGRTPDGRAYAVIEGYYAEITPEALETLKATVVDRNSQTAYYPDYNT